MKNIIFFGYGSEYLLSPLIKHLGEFNVVEINNYEKKHNLENLKKNNYDAIVFSSHLNLDKFLYNVYYENIENFISPIDILNQLKIKKKYYLIHDLTDFYLNEEINLLDKIDKIFSPIDYDDPLFGVKVENIGWIKSFKSSHGSEIINKKIFFLSDIGYYEKNFENFINDFKEIIKDIDYYKLPSMKTRPSKIVNYFSENKINEISDKESSYNYLKNNQIYTNGISSIIFETLLHKNFVKVIKSTTNSFYEYNNLLKNPFTKFNLIRKLNFSDDLIEILPNEVELNIEFDFSKFKNFLRI